MEAKQEQWAFDGFLTGVGQYAVTGPDGKIVAYVPGAPGDVATETRAHRIAALPVVLAALRECCHELAELREYGRYDGHGVIDRARRALSAAEGRTA